MTFIFPTQGIPRVSPLGVIAGAVASLSLAAPVWSQTAAPAQPVVSETNLKEITVSAEREATTEGSGSYTARATTIGKSVQSLKETPQSVTVVTRQRLDDQNIRTLDNALQNTAGILVQDSSGHERTFFSRGFEIDTIQYDGVPTQRNSGFNISPDLSGYDRIEVLRGPAGLFNGAGQPGGTVNLVRKRPLATRQFTSQLTLGSWDMKRADADLNLVLNDAGSLRGRLVVAREDRKYFYDVASTKRSVVYAVVEADIGPRTTLGAGLNYEQNELVPHYGGLPRYTDGRDLGLPRSTYLNGAFGRTKIENTTLFVDLNHRFNDDWKLKVGLANMRENNFDLTASNFGAVNPVTLAGQSLSSFSQHLEGRQLALDATLNGSFQAFGRKHDVLVGGNTQKRHYNLDSQLWTVANAAFNPFNFNPYAYSPSSVPGRPRALTFNKLQQSGIYGSLRLALSDPLKLIVGGRQSFFENTATNLVNGVQTSNFKEKGQFTPFGALTYDLTPEWSVYGSYAQIFRSQANLYTVTGSRLDPATGTNYEVGMKGALAGGKINTSVALFHITENNRAQTVVAAPCAANPNPNSACSAAEGEVQSQGLDAEVSGEVLPRLQVSAGYTYNTTKYLKDRNQTGAATANENQPLLSFAPRHMVRIWSNYQFADALSAWSLGGGVNLQSKTYKLNGLARVEQRGYAVWSARVGYKINRNLTASLSLNNIFDKTYYRTLGSSTGGGNWYGEPRSVSATLQASF